MIFQFVKRMGQGEIDRNRERERERVFSSTVSRPSYIQMLLNNEICTT